jgi:hypothetical protein
LTKDEKLAHHVHSFAARVISPLRLPAPAKLARAVWVNLSASAGSLHRVGSIVVRPDRDVDPLGFTFSASC